MKFATPVSARLALATIAVVGLLPRASTIDAPLYVNAHAWRQADSAAFVAGYLQHDLNPLSPRVAKHPCAYFDAPFGEVESELPLIGWAAALPLAALGLKWAPPWYLRAISLGFYLLTCIWLFALARRFAGEPDERGKTTEALIAVAAFTLFPICAFYTQSPQPDGPSLFFVTAFLLHFDRWLERERRLDALFSVSLVATALLLKASNAYVLLVGLYLLSRRRRAREVTRDWRMWLFATAALAPAIAWYGYAHQSTAQTFDIWTFRKFTHWSDYLDINHWKWFGLRFTIPVLTISGCALSALGCLKGRAPGLPRAWFGACAVFLLVAIKANRTHVYYQLIFVMPASIACAKATLWFWRRAAVGRVALAVLLAAHLAIGAQVLWDRATPGELWGYFRIDLPPIHELVPLVRKNVPETDRFVSTVAHPSLFVGAHRLGYIPKRQDALAVVECMRKGVAYALVPRQWFNPPGVRVVARSRHYQVWHRVPVETFNKRSSNAPR